MIILKYHSYAQEPTMTALHTIHLDTDQDYEAAYALMRELRPHLNDAVSFAAQVRRQAQQGYRLLASRQNGQIKALAGYRIQENTLYGRFLYVDDLVTAADTRSQGLGAQLIDTLREEARRQGCAHFVLDTGLANARAQRFYFRQGLLAAGLHFRQAL